MKAGDKQKKKPNREYITVEFSTIFIEKIVSHACVKLKEKSFQSL